MCAHRLIISHDGPPSIDTFFDFCIVVFSSHCNLWDYQKNRIAMSTVYNVQLLTMWSSYIERFWAESIMRHTDDDLILLYMRFSCLLQPQNWYCLSYLSSYRSLMHIFIFMVLFAVTMKFNPYQCFCFFRWLLCQRSFQLM